MTDSKLQAVLQMAVNSAFWKVQNAAPKDTGNLAYNAIRLDKTQQGYRIYVDSKIAPYMVYTEEPWISDRWHGKENPNEKWFENVVEDVAYYIAEALGGEVVKVWEGKNV